MNTVTVSLTGKQASVICKAIAEAMQAIPEDKAGLLPMPAEAAEALAELLEKMASAKYRDLINSDPESTFYPAAHEKYLDMCEAWDAVSLALRVPS